jgi:hypothetical protein
MLNAGEHAIARGNAATVVLVLITDDRDKCDDVPERAVNQLEARGLTVHLFVVGLNVDRAAREDLMAAIAAAEPGSHLTEVSEAGQVPVMLNLP